MVLVNLRIWGNGDDYTRGLNACIYINYLIGEMKFGCVLQFDNGLSPGYFVCRTLITINNSFPIPFYGYLYINLPHQLEIQIINKGVFDKLCVEGYILCISIIPHPPLRFIFSRKTKMRRMGWRPTRRKGHSPQFCIIYTPVCMYLLNRNVKSI